MLPAGATPAARTARLAEVGISVPAGHGLTIRMTLNAIRADAGDRLEASISTCGRTCGPARSFAGPLPSGALQLDPQQASGRLHTSLGGLPLQVSWVPQLGAGVERGYVDGGGGTTDISTGTYRGDDAVAAVSVAGRSCHGRATVGTEADVSLSDSRNNPEPLSRLRITAVGAPSCTG
jgi:hypothetical protein